VLRSISALSNISCFLGKGRFSAEIPAVLAILILALSIGWEGHASYAAQPDPRKPDVEKPLKNADVIMMSKTGFGDDVVIAKVNQTPVEELDVSVPALLGLKKKGVSEPVIEAMIKRVDQRAKRPRTAPAAPPESGSPAAKGQGGAGVSSQPACVANYQTDGGIQRGETKRSFRDYPEANSDSLFDTLARSVTTGGWQISKSNREAGTITGAANVRNLVEDVKQFFGVEVTKLTLTVLLKKKESGGTRVETVLEVPIGTHLPDEDAQTIFCRILGP
jgi:hypothetical protein